MLFARDDGEAVSLNPYLQMFWFQVAFHGKKPHCRSSSLGFPVAFPKMWTRVSHPSLLVCQYVFPILSYPNPCEHLKPGGIIYHDHNQQTDSLFISLQHDNLLNQVGYYLPQLPTLCNFLMSGEGEAKGQDRVSVSWQQLVWLNTRFLWFQNVPNLCRSATKLVL
jgi:hypothetical protein